jgi:hypothetical protein
MTRIEALSETDRVLLLHRHKGLLQRVAKRCRVHPSLVSRVFHGKARSTRVEKELAKALSKLAAPMPRRTKPSDRARELRWIAEHRRDYAGQWVAVDAYRLVASGPHAREVITAARQSGRSPLIGYIEPADALLWGGW